MDARGLILVSAFALACERSDYRPVDRVLALPGRMPDAAEQVRICVDDVGERLLGARFSGQMVFAGAPAGIRLDLTLDALDSEGLTIAQWIGDDIGSYTVGEALDCDEGCDPCEARGRLAQPGEPSVVIGISLEQD